MGKVSHSSDRRVTVGLIAGGALLLVLVGLRLGSSGVHSSQALKETLNRLADRVHELEEQQLRQLQSAREAEQAAAAPASPVGPARSYLDDETNVRIPHGLTSSQRLRLLELKVASATGWLKDPFFGFNAVYSSTCKHMSNLSEYGCAAGRDQCPGSFDHDVCLDDWTPGQGNCLVYDFGIREDPEFGEVMAKTFDCEVHAFDPSPITLKWFPTSEVAKLPNYHFHPYGAAGTDGDIQLHEYDWGQVSIVRDVYPQDNPKDVFNLPVKTLGTIMKELGHEGREIDLLKLDVEGSEFSLLEDALDSLGCLPAKQVTLEWHHYAFDARYGGGSSPAVNAIVNIMHACGLKMFWRHDATGWMTGETRYKEAGLHDIRYNLASFHKVKSQQG